MVALAARQIACFEIASGTMPSGARIDLDRGIIYGVKVAGFQSRNKGRTIGLTAKEFGDAVDKPYSYDRKAFESALGMYEGSAVYRDHPGFSYDDKGARTVHSEGRSSDDLIGTLRNCRVMEDGLYADLHYLKSHPFSMRLVEVADRCPDKFALSHEAYADAPVVRGGKIVLTKILAVDGVALTAHKPGTTSGLFESLAQRKHAMPSIRELFTALPEGTPYRARVLELASDPTMSPMMDAPVDAPPLEGDAAATPEDAVKSGFKAMVMAVIDADGTVEEMRTKLNGLLDAFATAQAAVGGAGGGDKGKGPAPDIAAAETLAKTQKALAIAEAKAESMQLLSEAKHPLAIRVVEAMALLPDTAARKEFVAALPVAAAAPGGNPLNNPIPRSAPAPTPGKQVVETVKPAFPQYKPGEMATALRGG